MSPFGTAEPSHAERPRIAGGLVGQQILVPLLNPEVPAITDQIAVARSFARSGDATLDVMKPGRLPEAAPNDGRVKLADTQDRELLDWALDEVDTADRGVQGTFLYNRRLARSILETVNRRDVDTLILPRKSSEGLVRRSITDRLATQADCDVITVNGQPRLRSPTSILLPIAGGPHSGLATDVARCIARDHDAWIDVLHVVEEDPSPRQQDLAEEYMQAAYQRLDRPETTSKWMLEAEGADTAAAIVEQSQYYDATVIGAPTGGRLHRFVHGSKNRSVRTDARSVVLSVRNYESHPAL